MEKVIIVGRGDYFRKMLMPTLIKLESEGLVEVVSTVDVLPPPDFGDPKINSLEHLVRKEEQRLSDLLKKYQGQNPIVVLGHANELHTSDALDLLENNFKILLEKPFCINHAQLELLSNAFNKFSGCISLLEYYLMMKSAPLMLLAGKIKKDSFYLSNPDLLRVHQGLSDYAQSPKDLISMFNKVVGKPKCVISEVLEGEGDTGKVDHRGDHLIDLRKGGGMIQDLGLHSTAPIFALEEFIGKIDETFKDGSVQIARSNEYLQMAKDRFGLEDEFIGESYAEFHFKTSLDVPVYISLGKYVLNNQNQRRLIIVGSEGVAYLNMSNCVLSLAKGERLLEPVLEIPKMPESKYYPVIRAGLDEVLSHGTDFGFSKCALKAQALILNILDKAHNQRVGPVIYQTGSLPGEIFK